MLEQLVPPFHLAVVRVFDLDPGRALQVGVVHPVSALRYDAFHVETADILEKPDSVLLEAAEIEQGPELVRDEPAELCPALEERLAAVVLAVEPQ